MSEDLSKLRLPLATSEAVLTELFYLISDSRHQTESAWNLVNSGMIMMASIENGELHEIHALMSRYADRPMDFADATLVYLAKREGLSMVFTIDRDFDIYRIDGRRRFQVVPTRRE